jgi:DNA-binding protein H-NS
VKLVEQMLELHRQLAAARTPQEQTALTRQIADQNRPPYFAVSTT